MDEFEAEFYRNGIDGVNRKLQELYPNAEDRVEKLLYMEATGKWDVRWHESSDGPDEYDDGIVRSYGG